MFPNPHFSLYYQVPDNSAFEAEPTKVSGIKAYIHEVSEFLCVACFNNYKDYWDRVHLYDMLMPPIKKQCNTLRSEYEFNKF